MMFERFFTLERPHFHLVLSDPSTFENLRLQLLLAYPEKALGIRVIRGGYDVQSFFHEISAVLQFPYYFGYNWNAFVDCLTDLDWLAADAYLLLIRNAHLLFRDDTHPAFHFQTLLEILEEVSEGWLTPRQGPPRPFHVLFQCPANEIAPLAQRLVSVGAKFEQIAARMQEHIVQIQAL